MAQTASGLIKSQAVRPGGTCRLGSAEPAPATSGQPTAAPTARIVRQGEGLAVIEVACGCGSRIELHCQYQEGKGGA